MVCLAIRLCKVMTLKTATWQLARMVLVAVAPIVATVGGLWIASSVYASGYQPLPLFPMEPAVADVAISGANSNLNAPDSYFELSSSWDFTGSIDVKVSCWNVTANAGLSAQVTTRSGTVLASGSSNCSGDKGAPSTVDFTISMQSSYDDPDYPNDLETIRLHVTKINGEGHQPFFVSVANTDNYNNGSPVATYLGDPNRNNTNPSYNNGFGIWMNGSTEFNFQPPCNYDFSQDIYLKWADANVGQYDSNGQLIQPGNISWTLTEYDNNEYDSNYDQPTGNSWTMSGASLGTALNSSQPGWFVTSFPIK